MKKRCIFFVLWGLVVGALLSSGEEANMTQKTEDIEFVRLLEKMSAYSDYLENHMRENRMSYLHQMDAGGICGKIREGTATSDETMLFLNALISVTYEQNGFKKIEDPKLFSMVIDALHSHHKGIRNLALQHVCFFSDSLVDHEMASILELFERKEVSAGLITCIPISEKTRKEHSAFFADILKSTKVQLAALDKVSPTGKVRLTRINLLYLCAYLGDEESLQALIAILKNCDDYSIRQPEFKHSMSLLLELNTKDAVMAVLDKFKGNYGQPEFYSGESPRFFILYSLYTRYRNDAFFKSRKPYFDSFAQTRKYPLDGDFFKNDDEIKLFFEEFKKWAWDRYQYDMDITGIDYSINKKERYSKFFRK